MNEISSSMRGEYLLLPPQTLEIPIEKALMKRISVRNFTNQPVSDQELSNVLWSAYGKRIDGSYTVPKINGVYAAVIYVIKEDAVYTYNPDDHSLILYKEGDYRNIVSDGSYQYWAPIELGLCWDTNIADKNFAAAQVGAVGQNIYFSAISQNLATIFTSSNTSDPEPIGLPENHKAIGMMPLGHPNYPYNLKYRPFCISFLPRITFSKTNLTTVLEIRETITEWKNEELSRKDISYLTWSSYGYSYYIDETQADMKFVTRHHTVPSCHGYYPFDIYIATKSGIFRYVYGLFTIDRSRLPFPIPLIGAGIPSYFFFPVAVGDYREDIGKASEDYVKDAPYCLIPVLDIKKTIRCLEDLSGEKDRWNFYYEAGAASYNVLLEATALKLAGTIVSVTNKSAICNLLKLDEKKFDPMFIVPVGKKK
ncbi:MAG: nitroreductase family protein [Candidatus Thermoplasmatota archaeon]|nr:nitroreductase family protein [Candidatus Thermoplasmatota archaeon]